MTAKERIECLADAGSFVEIGKSVVKRSTDFGASEKVAEGDGVLTGYMTVNGNRVYVYSQDKEALGGTVGEMHAKKIAHVYELAVKMGAPVVGILDSNGVRLEEVTDSLEGFGVLYKAARTASGIVPTLALVLGQAGGGEAVLAGLSDFVLMGNDAQLFVNAPNTIPGNTKDKVNNASAAFQSAESGVVDFAGTEEEVIERAKMLIDVLPANMQDYTKIVDTQDDLNRMTTELVGVKDVRYIAQQISDECKFIELKEKFAPSMVTGFVILDGIVTGVYGNQEDKLTAEGLQKATDFIKFCDAFEIPMITFTNITGYDLSFDTEKNFVRTCGAYIAALTDASVAKVNFILNAEGTAYLLMNSKALGADLVYAAEDAEIGIMNPNSAAKILGGADLSQVAEEFAQKQTAEQAAKRGYVDEVISMADARRYALSAMEMLYTKRTDFAETKKHSSK